MSIEILHHRAYTNSLFLNCFPDELIRAVRGYIDRHALLIDIAMDDPRYKVGKKNKYLKNDALLQQFLAHKFHLTRVDALVFIGIWADINDVLL